MPKRSIELFLQDILDACTEIEEFIQGYDYDQFVQDKKTYNAAIRSLEIIGKASTHLPDKIRSEYDQIDWRSMVGMRNIIIHEYFGTDNEIIWKTVCDDIPALKRHIDKIIYDIKN